MNCKSFTLLFALLLTFFAFSCATRSSPAPAEKAPAAGAKETTGGGVAVKEEWEAKWESALRAARKEGVVVVYSSSVGPSIKEMTPLFDKKFGINIELISARGAELTVKLFQERKAGLFLADVVLTGMNNFYNETKPGGASIPMDEALILPEVLETKNWYGNGLPWGDTDHQVFMSYAFPNNTLAINSNLMKADEIKSYNDLLDPKWKGKMVMNDPTVAGVGSKSFSVIGYQILNLDFFRQLAKQEPVITRDQRQQVEWLAQGKFHILLFPRPAPMMEFKRAGAPVAYVPTPKEGTYLSVGGGNISLINRAPHPAASRVFLNWFLSKEGQTMITAIEGAQSARVDVPTDQLDPLLVRQPGVKYFTGSDTPEWLARDQEFFQSGRDIFGHLMR